MELLRDLAMFILMMFGIAGWIALGLLVLAVSPFVVGMILIGAVIFAPDMDGY
jgi:hypothetical protein